MFDRVWAESKPYLRARKNDVHVPISFAFAQKLLARHRKANGEVVSLAILLHDHGWARIDARDIAEKAFGPDMKAVLQNDVRRLHETLGVEIASDILGRLRYRKGVIAAVNAIIDGHDSRPEARSLEDEIVKDADKLWRFTTTGVSIACDWHKFTPARYVCHLQKNVLPSLFSASARAMAGAALRDARAALMTETLGE